jgi:hypothetical protein
MFKASRYCKAYPIEEVARFAPIASRLTDWQQRAPAAADDQSLLRKYVFVHDDLTVSGTIWLDEEPLFAEHTPEWIAFCTGVLAFSVPDYVNEPSVTEAAVSPQ